MVDEEGMYEAHQQWEWERANGGTELAFEDWLVWCDACQKRAEKFEDHEKDCPFAQWDDPAYVAHCNEQLAELILLEMIKPVKRSPWGTGSYKAVDLFDRCDRCQQAGVLYERVVYTIGWEGHPGAEQEAFHMCEPCLTGVSWMGYGAATHVQRRPLPIESNEWNRLLGLVPEPAGPTNV